MGSKSRLQRSKKKKKFISLRHHLTPSQTQHPIEPDELACLLEQDSGARTITDLFESTSSASSSIATFDQNEALSPASPSIDEWDEGDGLARRALRGRERMVFCKSTKEVWCGMQQRRLSLKLDYEEILTAWSDRGSLYIDGEGPQVVPELLEDDSVAPNVIVDVGNSSGWRVPQMEVEEGSKRNREERVMRYKAKRQSRLFSKRIRYEVRKLNAEKRPRIKGRFVKRIDDMQGSSLVNDKKEDNCSY